MNARRLVHVVEDEEAVRASIAFLLRTCDHEVRTYESGSEFLSRLDGAAPGCVLLDIRMPEIDGLEVQRLMTERAPPLPVILLTGHGDVPIAVQAMRQGAVDFLEKPFEKAQLLRALTRGFALLEHRQTAAASVQDAALRVATLTPREQEVLRGMVEGLPNKSIALNLGISPRTVEVHRANLMSKLEARSLSEALRLAFSAGLAG